MHSLLLDHSSACREFVNILTQRTPVAKFCARDMIENNAHSPHPRALTTNNRTHNMQRPDAAAVIVRISL